MAGNVGPPRNEPRHSPYAAPLHSSRSSRTPTGHVWSTSPGSGLLSGLQHLDRRPTGDQREQAGQGPGQDTGGDRDEDGTGRRGGGHPPPEDHDGVHEHRHGRSQGDHEQQVGRVERRRADVGQRQRAGRQPGPVPEPGEEQGADPAGDDAGHDHEHHRATGQADDLEHQDDGDQRVAEDGGDRRRRPGRGDQGAALGVRAQLRPVRGEQRQPAADRDERRLRPDDRAERQAGEGGQDHPGQGAWLGESPSPGLRPARARHVRAARGSPRRRPARPGPAPAAATTRAASTTRAGPAGLPRPAAAATARRRGSRRPARTPAAPARPRRPAAGGSHGCAAPRGRRGPAPCRLAPWRACPVALPRRRDESSSDACSSPRIRMPRHLLGATRCACRVRSGTASLHCAPRARRRHHPWRVRVRGTRTGRGAISRRKRWGRARPARTAAARRAGRSAGGSRSGPTSPAAYGAHRRRVLQQRRGHLPQPLDALGGGEQRVVAAHGVVGSAARRPRARAGPAGVVHRELHATACRAACPGPGRLP